MTSKQIRAGAVAMTGVLLLGACGGGGPGGSGGDFTDGKLVLAILNDQSGIYKDASGPNSVKAVKMAVADYTKKYGDKAVVDDIEVTSTDHQNKPDIANTKAKELYERGGADVILDVPTSSAALAVANQAKSHKKLFLDVSAATTELTGAQCNKYTFQWAYNTYMLANGTGTTVTQNGDKKWHIIYPDYQFGQDMTKSFTEAIKGAGGTVQGTIPTPFPNDNFATFLTKAGSTSPDVIGTMQAGGDLINVVKQFNESGLKDKGINLAVGLMLITDIHSSASNSSPARCSPTPGTGTWTRSRARGRTGSATRPARGRPSNTLGTTPPRCSTWRRSRKPAPTTPTRSSANSKARRSMTCSCATAKSAPRTTSSSTTRTWPASSSRPR